MNTKVLCVAVLALTALIFVANRNAAREGCQTPECERCLCTVKLSYPDSATGKNEPSCSVVFDDRDETPAGPPGHFVFKLARKELFDFRARCNTAVVCDKAGQADLTCFSNYKDKPIPERMGVWPNQRCSVSCERKDLYLKLVHINCNQWKTKAANKTPSKKPSSSGGGPSGLLSQTSPWQNDSPFSAFVPVSYNAEPPQDGDESVIFSDLAWWKLVEGDAGIEEGVLTVTSGEAIVSSLCTGDTIQVIGPGTFTLPRCYGDSIGLWRGAYARRMPKGVLTPVTATLDLRREGRLVTGELTTAEGTLKVVAFNQTSSSIEVKASGTIGGKQRDIVLYGTPNKGEIEFDGREGSPGERTTRIIGFFKRPYVADSGLLPALVNQPYFYKLFAFSPAGKTLTFSLKEGKMPGGISLDSQTGTLRGTPVELGNFNFRVVISDSEGNTFEQPLTLSVKKIILAFPAIQDAIVGQPFSARLQAVGGSPPYKYTAGMPSGLALDPITGEISGTPTRESTGPVTVFVNDSRNIQELIRLTFRVRGTTIMTSHFLPEGKIGSPFSVRLQAVGNRSPITWSIGRVEIGEMGLTLEPRTGELSGTPTQTGTFMLQVRAQANDYHTRDFALTVLP